MTTLLRSACFVAAVAGCLAIGAAVIALGLIEDVGERRRRMAMH